MIHVKGGLWVICNVFYLIYSALLRIESIDHFFLLAILSIEILNTDKQTNSKGIAINRHHSSLNNACFTHNNQSGIIIHNRRQLGVNKVNKKNIHVVGAVIIKDDKILCAQRGESKNLSYKWEFPGGKIESGETPQQALKREIQEEMECDIAVGEKIDHTVYEYDFGVVHLTTFYCTLQKGDPILKEHHSIKWLFKHELSSLDWAPADIPTIENLENM